ncbi:TPA: preprotein translocase subunit SecG [Candidatus Komeilibacteria bacterium]|nr:MAG: Preprotein translocase, SecG subunit [Parcubacteria group bacterium GW2011_GWF2_45_11]KKT98683.1 MAG: Preprotein translocase, SecG subunit [Parcubacteria group bacterium GW2011_GWC2_45_15]OGY93647.1 MAG: preprotein translocase subunit SecG [Candidatus Komeilibacteria bacterium RIFOXYA2_FULL_45_9]OGY94602.1 MAG: preprotein translocase subunit SecG [Candidatus Komeilibacteria bacterium RIFOXYC2_FULL_45_12]HAH04132.1 preprotein translocase subunit SecG [Candidatus Komeilibacteria bacterium
MQSLLQIVQLVIAVLLIAAIMIQNRGAGLGGIFGGEGGVYRTKRGAEKTIFIATIVLAVLFLGLAVVNVFLSK